MNSEVNKEEDWDDEDFFSHEEKLLTQESLSSQDIDKIEEVLSFQDIYASLILHEEIKIVIPVAELERTKTGLKNAKGKLASKNRSLGLPVDASILQFSVGEATDFPEHLTLTISINNNSKSNKGVVAVKKIIVPDAEL